MAGLDTRDKRMSMLGIAKASTRLLQNPTGTIGAAARAMLEFLYSGILPAAPVAATPRSITGYFASRSNAPALTASRSNAPSLVASQSNVKTLIAGDS